MANGVSSHVSHVISGVFGFSKRPSPARQGPRWGGALLLPDAGRQHTRVCAWVVGVRKGKHTIPGGPPPRPHGLLPPGKSIRDVCRGPTHPIVYPAGPRTIGANTIFSPNCASIIYTLEKLPHQKFPPPNGPNAFFFCFKTANPAQT